VAINYVTTFLRPNKLFDSFIMFSSLDRSAVGHAPAKGSGQF